MPARLPPGVPAPPERFSEEVEAISGEITPDYYVRNLPPGVPPPPERFTDIIEPEKAPVPLKLAEARQDAERLTRLQSAGASAVKGGGHVISSGLKAMDIADQQGVNRMLDAFTFIDDGGSQRDLPIRGGGMDIIVGQYEFSSPEQRSKTRSIFEAKLMEPQAAPFYQAGMKLDEYLAEQFRTDPEFSEELFAGKVPQGLGSMIAFVAATIGTGGPGGALAGGLVNKTDQFEDALDSGATIEEAYLASDFGAMIGLSEGIPITRILDRISRSTGGLTKQLLLDMLKGGTEEAVQETFQRVMGNVVASDIVGYDPEREWWGGAAEGAGVGFTTGGLVSFLGSIASGRRGRGPAEIEAPPPPEGEGPPLPEVEDLIKETEQAQAEALLTDEEIVELIQKEAAERAVPVEEVTPVEEAAAPVAEKPKPKKAAKKPKPKKKEEAPDAAAKRRVEEGREQERQRIDKERAAAEAGRGDIARKPTEITPEEEADAQEGVRPPVKAKIGKKDTASTQAGQDIEFDYAIVPADDLIASHDDDLKVNPDYPAALQPRDRARMASKTQVHDIATKLRPERLGVSPATDTGAPIIGKDGVVESGNARTIALKRALTTMPEARKKYVDWLQNNAEALGLTKDQVVGTKNPVLVRIRRTDVDRVEFAYEGGKAGVAPMSSTEHAVQDAKRVNVESLAITEKGTINAAANSEFIRRFNEGLSEQERGAMMTAEGKLSQDGARRIRNAVFAKAYGNENLVAMTTESTDSNVRNLTNGLFIAAPAVAKMRDRIAKGTLKDVDFTADLATAVQAISSMREQGHTNIPEFLKQSDIFGGLSPKEKAFVLALDAASKSAKRVGEFVNDLVDAVGASADPRQAGLDLGMPEEGAQLLEDVVASLAPVKAPKKIAEAKPKKKPAKVKPKKKAKTKPKKPAKVKPKKVAPKKDEPQLNMAPVTDLKGFERWFKKTKPVDEEGNPGAFLNLKDVDPKVYTNLPEGPRGQGMTIKEVQDIIAPLVKGWGRSVTIDVVGHQGAVPFGVPERTLGAHMHGNIWLIASNLTSKEEVVRTLMHEAVGHFGLKKLIGPEQFKNLLAQVDLMRRTGNVTIRRMEKSVTASHGAIDKETMAHEILARMAESKRHFPILDKLYADARRYLRRVGFDIKFTDADIRGLIVSATRAMEAGHRGQMIKRAVIHPDPPFPPKGVRPTLLTGQYGMREETMVDMFERLFIDDFNRIKRAQGVIVERGGVLTSESNVYLTEELTKDAIAAAYKKFQQNYVRWFIEEAKQRELSIDDINLYLVAKHAKERNEHIATINPLFPDGGSGMPTVEAELILENFRTKKMTEDLEVVAKKVYEMMDMSLKMQVDAGLISQEQADRYQGKYQFYVPLKSLDDIQSKGAGIPRTGEGYDTRGRQKRATGRFDAPTDTLAHAIGQASETIVRAGHAPVGQALVRLVVQNPDADLWTVGEVPVKAFFDPTGEQVWAMEEIPGDDLFGESPLLIPVQVGTKGKVVYKIDQGWVRDSSEAFVVMVKGKAIVIRLKDPIMARQMKRMGVERLGKAMQQVARFTRWLAAINTRWSPDFIPNNWTRDVETAAIRIMGEQEGGVSLFGKVFKGMGKAMQAVWRSEKEKPTRKGNEYDRYFEEYEEVGARISFFSLETIQDIERRLRKEINSIGRDPGVLIKNTTELVKKYIGDNVEAANTAIENGTRFSFYVELRKRGWSKEKAGSAAKNLTVNFSRKGELGPWMGAMYLFFTAGVGGSVLVARSAATFPAVRKILLGMMAGGYMLAEMNRLIGAPGDEEDENRWDDTNDYIKRTNIVLLHPDKGASKFKLPYGFNTPVVAGYLISDMFHGKKTPGQAASTLMVALMESFNPLGGGGDPITLVMPTAVDPFFQHKANENFAGFPIMPENLGVGVAKPNSELYWSSVRPWSKATAQWLNKNTIGPSGEPGTQFRAGGIDISPEVIDHYLDFFTGGAGRFVQDSATLAINMVHGEKTPPHKIPIFRSFYGETPEGAVPKRFRENLTELNIEQKEYDAAFDRDLRDGTRTSVEYLDTHQHRMAMRTQMNKFSRKLGRYNTQLRRLSESDAPASDKRRLEEEIRLGLRSQMIRFNKAFAEAKKKDLDPRKKKPLPGVR